MTSLVWLWFSVAQIKSSASIWDSKTFTTFNLHKTININLQWLNVGGSLNDDKRLWILWFTFNGFIGRLFYPHQKKASIMCISVLVFIQSMVFFFLLFLQVVGTRLRKTYLVVSMENVNFMRVDKIGLAFSIYHFWFTAMQ